MFGISCSTFLFSVSNFVSIPAITVFSCVSRSLEGLRWSGAIFVYWGCHSANVNVSSPFHPANSCNSMYSISSVQLTTPLHCVAPPLSTLFCLVHAMDLLCSPLSSVPMIHIVAWTGRVPALDVPSTVPEQHDVWKLTETSSIFACLPYFLSSEPPLPVTSPVRPCSCANLQLSVLPHLPTDPPRSLHSLIDSSFPALSTSFWPTASHFPTMITPVSGWLCLPLSMPTLSS